MSVKCPFCGSTKIMRFRRDSDWGGGHHYDAVNGDDDCTGLDAPDVDIYHCRSCESFFDPHKTFPEIKVIPVAAVRSGLENLEDHVKWLTAEFKRSCDTLRKIAATTPDAAMNGSAIRRAVEDMQAAHAKIQQYEEQCELLRHLMHKHTVTITAASSAGLNACFVSPSGLPPITEFRGDYSFLSNFSTSYLTYFGIQYSCVECAFQAQKTMDETERLKISRMKPSYAKTYGKKLSLRPDWEKVKVNIMRTLLFAKFTQNQELAAKLVATKDAVLMEMNQWGDTFWGMRPDGTGENILGKLLMEMRDHPHIQKVAADD